MDVQASATCKWLKHKKREDADLAKHCLSLKLVAMNAQDVSILTALYKLWMDGGKFDVEVPSEELKVAGTMKGMRHMDDEEVSP